MIQAIQQMWNRSGSTSPSAEIEQATIIDDFVARQVPGGHLLPVRGGQPRPQLRVVEHHHHLPHRHDRAQLHPEQRPEASSRPCSTGRHTTDAGHPGRPPTRRSTNGWPRTLPYLWMEQYLFSEVATGSSTELRQPDPARRVPRLRRSTKASSSPSQIWLATSRIAATGGSRAHHGQVPPHAPRPVGGGGVHHLDTGVHAGPPAPGNPVDVILGPNDTPQNRALLYKQLGLNKPLSTST